MAKMRGGRSPTKAEAEMMAEAISSPTAKNYRIFCLESPTNWALHGRRSGLNES